MDRATGIEKPRQSLAGLWNISFGFFGIQIGFALQNANMSRIFQSLGSSLDDLPALWVAAPLTGLLVQPIIGHMSDRTWLGRLGRRRPYFVLGAILAALSLFLMPLAPALLFAALLLWMLDASLNISMEPFRAFVGDMLRKDQHTAGYAVQTAFIGAGAVLGSLIPPALEMWGVSNVAEGGGIPDTVRYAFWIGGAALFAAVLWTVITTNEYSPQEMELFGETADHPDSDATIRALAARTFGTSLVWIVAGVLVVVGVEQLALEKEMYLLGGLLIAYGLASIIAIALARKGSTTNMLAHIVGDFAGMPAVMKKLGAGPVLQLVGPVHHVDLHDAGRCPIFLRLRRSGQLGLSGRRQPRRHIVRDLQWRGSGRGAHLAAMAQRPDRQGAHAHGLPRMRRSGLRQLPRHPRPAVVDPFGESASALPGHRSSPCPTRSLPPACRSGSSASTWACSTSSSSSRSFWSRPSWARS